VVSVAGWRRDAMYLVGVFLSFLRRGTRPAARNDVVGRSLGTTADEVKRHRGEQTHAAALQEQHAVLLRDRPAAYLFTYLSIYLFQRTGK